MSEIDQTPSPLPSTALRWRCDAEVLCLEADDAVDPQSGQQRALEAIRLSLAFAAPRNHVFVCGPSGLGKMSAVRRLLEAEAPVPKVRFDLVYVKNFKQPDFPRLIRLRAGEGRRFKSAIQELLERLPETVIGTLNSEALDRKRRATLRQIESEQERDLGSLRDEAERHGLVLVRVEEGELSNLELRPRLRRKVSSFEALAERVEQGKFKVDAFETLLGAHDRLDELLQQRLDEFYQREREAIRTVREAALKLVRRALLRATEQVRRFSEHERPEPSRSPHIPAPMSPLDAPQGESGSDALAGAPREESEVSAWLDGLIEWVEENLVAFESFDDDDGPALGELRALGVNLLHEASLAPAVLFEYGPTLTKLLGTIERSGDESRGGLDFNDIRAGSLVHANGGVLVIDADELAQESGAWRTLIRSLKREALEIQSPDQLFSSSGPPLKPQPIPLDLKVIAVGDESIYRTLYLRNDDFGRVFKFKAEFQENLRNDMLGRQSYLQHARRIEREEQLLPLSADALARWVELGARLAGRRDLLSTRFDLLTDVLREADLYARQVTGSVAADEISVEALQRAIDQRRRRHMLIEDESFRLFEQSIIELTPEGEAVGLVHGLTVLDFGDHCFGQPCRVSATCCVGDAGVTSVEREVALSGQIHDKGALLLSAYVQSRYLPDATCSFSATLSFDQLHDEIEGDSASLAELLALLSAIGESPLYQTIAVTGAVDQRGKVCAIGGVNEKIEGFFRLCEERGLLKADVAVPRGAIIPKSNVEDLMLDHSLIAAVEANRFQIWPVSTVDEALAIIASGQSGGKVTSLNTRVRERLQQISAQALRERGCQSR